MLASFVTFVWVLYCRRLVRFSSDLCIGLNYSPRPSWMRIAIFRNQKFYTW